MACDTKNAAPSPSRYTASGLLAILFWSTTVGLARSIVEQLGVLTGGACIYLLGGILATGYLLASGKLAAAFRGAPRRYLVGCGLLFVTYTVTLYVAIGGVADRLQVLEIGLINYLWPSLTLLLAVPLLRKKPRALLLPGTAIATVGIFLTVTQAERFSWAAFASNVGANQTPYLLALLAAISWALYSNLSRRWAGDSESGAVAAFMLGTGIVFAALRLVFPEKSSWSTKPVLEVCYLALAVTLAYAFWDVAMRKGDVILVASCSYFTPFLSTLVTCIYLQVTPGRKLWAGCGLIMLGAFVCKRSVIDGPGRSALVPDDSESDVD